MNSKKILEENWANSKLKADWPLLSMYKENQYDIFEYIHYVYYLN